MINIAPGIFLALFETCLLHCGYSFAIFLASLALNNDVLENYFSLFCQRGSVQAATPPSSPSEPSLVSPSTYDITASST